MMHVEINNVDPDTNDKHKSLTPTNGFRLTNSNEKRFQLQIHSISKDVFYR